MSVQRVQTVLGDKEISLETGRMAKQADGAVLVKSGKNAVLVTACMSKQVPEGIDFFPLTVNYSEKFYAAGKIPGGYFKREGRPTTKEILVSRLIDRPIRPLFPEGFYNEVQIFATALSADQVNSPDMLGIVGASAALCISEIPFAEPVGGVRICKLNGQFIVNPSIKEIEESELDVIVAGSRAGITMVEGGSTEVPKDLLLEALDVAQEYINKQIEMIEELVEQIKPVKYQMEEKVSLIDDELKTKIREIGYAKIKEAHLNPDKKQRSENVSKAKEGVLETLEITEENVAFSEIKKFLDELEVDVFRKELLDNQIRPDGRKTNEIRPISIEVDVLDSVHGSALFTRGQTQSLGITTLGSQSDVQFIDSIDGENTKRFMLHYNFPPYSTGEVKRAGGVSRREVGHGNLAERATEVILPDFEDFPYTIRTVSEILESNGSSSMATVCSTSLSLMSCGVPIKAPVAGIAMGLVWDRESNKYEVLTDIQGIEDHHGDMDFKVTSTRKGITAFQMDIKTIGLSREIMSKALDQALEGVHFILDKMQTVIEKPRETLSQNAPKIKSLTIPEKEIGNVIGSGGKTIKKIMSVTETQVNIDDNGTVTVVSQDEEMIDKAVYIIEKIARGFDRNEAVQGTVTRVEDYGVFVELVPGQTGLVHRSKFKDRTPMQKLFNVGDKMDVLFMGIDEKKRIVLALNPASENEEKQ